MKLLGGPSLTALAAKLANAHSLLAFDFDGTLAPIVAQRTRAAMRASTRRVLAGVCERYPVAVISGRARSDVAARVRGLGVKYVVGNHGIEPSAATGAVARAVSRAHGFLARSLASVPGVELEDKRFSLSLHFRGTKRPAAAHREILAAVRALPLAVRVVPGKQVVNVVPAGTPHKGDAVRRLAEAARAERVLYVGDDGTDEDVFALEEPGLVTVRVARSWQSEADYYLPRQAAVDGLLAALEAAREG
ncbi:MAG: trehalose-phosphatase [Myxococcota bacterium]